MLAAILLFGVLGVVLQFRLAARREAAELAAQNRPELRAMQSVQAADSAMIDGDPRAAYTALGAAATALDEALAERADAPDLRRGRLVVTRRLAQLADTPAIDAPARPLFEDAVERARTLFEADSTDDQARLDRLGTARELAAHLVPIGAAAEAAALTRAAAEAIEASAAVVPPGPRVRAALADTWLDAARAHAAAAATEPAMTAARAALQHAEAGRGGDDDPITLAARAYNTAAAAVEIARQLDAKADAEAFERDATRLLEARHRMQPDDPAITRTLAARRVRLADHEQAAGRFDEAEAHHRAALDLRRALLTRRPADPDARRDLVRGLNQLGAFYSDRDRDPDALAAYAEAAAIGESLDADGLRLRIIALGNHAQLLGRLDRTREARDVAAKAHALALERADVHPADAEAAIDAVRAGLRHARLLRATPGADRTRAREVARAARDRLDRLPTPGERGAELDEALDALLLELR